jgi:hypothetical protein
MRAVVERHAVGSNAYAHEPARVRPVRLPASSKEHHRLMAACRITFNNGDTAEVQGDLQSVMDELHRVATRREHTFAVLQDRSGEPIALRPDAVLHVRAVQAPDRGPSAAG